MIGTGTNESTEAIGTVRRRAWGDRFLKYLVDPRRVSHKYILQALLCLFLSGPTFFDNFFNASATDIMNSLEITHEEFSLLVSIPSITGILCGAVAGMVTAYGSTMTALVTALAAYIGEIVIAYGIESSSYSTIMTGRVIFVLCWNLLGSVQKVIIFRQFSGPALAWIFALKIIAIRIGAVSGLYFAGSIMRQADGSLSGAMFFSVVLSGISLVCTFAFGYLYRGSSTARLVRPLLVGHRRNRPAEPGDTSGFSLSIPRDTWICCAVIFFYYGGLMPFETFGVDYLVTEYGFTRTDAGQALALLPFFSFFSPLISPVISSVKRQILAVIFAQAIIAGSIFSETRHAAFAPHLYICLIGVGHMLVANAVWLALAGVSPTEAQKTNAASISSAIYAVSVFVWNWITGRIRDSTGDYNLALTVLAGLVIIGALLAVYLQLTGDWRNSPTHNQPAGEEPLLAPSASPALIIKPNPVIDDNHFTAATNSN